MPVIVSLTDVVDEMESVSVTRTAYLNRLTGELITLSDEEVRLAESEADPEDLAPWEEEFLPKIREVLGNEDHLALPDSFEINEYRTMERFCLEVEDEDLREELLTAIRGRGAFRMFREVVNRRGIQDSWHRFRRAVLERIAVEWLEAHGIGYTEASE
jgi:hypothetical protein